MRLNLSSDEVDEEKFGTGMHASHGTIARLSRARVFGMMEGDDLNKFRD